jgi:hypothetical protein
MIFVDYPVAKSALSEAPAVCPPWVCTDDAMRRCLRRSSRQDFADFAVKTPTWFRLVHVLPVYRLHLLARRSHIVANAGAH